MNKEAGSAVAEIAKVALDFDSGYYKYNYGDYSKFLTNDSKAIKARIMVLADGRNILW